MCNIFGSKQNKTHEREDNFPYKKYGINYVVYSTQKLAADVLIFLNTGFDAQNMKYQSEFFYHYEIWTLNM